MGTTHDYNKDKYSSGIEQVANQTMWTIHFMHIPTKNCVFFEAFLKEFQDQFVSTWSEEPVFGRMDPIATFQNTARKISFSFDVVAESAIQAAQNTHRFQHLASFLYPTYERADSGNPGSGGKVKPRTMTSPPLMRIKFGNLIQDAKNPAATKNVEKTGLVGYVDGFSYNPVIESGFVPEKAGVFHALAYSVNVNFSVLHTHDLGWNKRKWAGPRGFPNGPGDRGINKTLQNECFIAPVPPQKKESTEQENQTKTPGSAKQVNDDASLDALLNSLPGEP